MTNKNNRKSIVVLLVLYILVVVAIILIGNVKYFELKIWFIIFSVDILLIIFCWKMFTQKRIIKMTLASNLFQKNLPKRERIFFLAFAYPIMPVLSFDFSIGGILWSILIFVIASSFIYKAIKNKDNV